MTGRREVVCKEAILVLDNRVLEVFVETTGQSYRHHVNWVTCMSKPTRNGVKVHIGKPMGGIGGDSLFPSTMAVFTVTAEEEPAVVEICREAMMQTDGYVAPDA